MDLTPAVEAFVNQKVGLLRKFIKSTAKLAEVRIEIGRPSKHHRKGLVYYAEINFKIGGKLLRATVEHADLYTAIDFARDDIERQLKKFKSKRRDLSRRPLS